MFFAAKSNQKLRSESKRLFPSLEQIERQIRTLDYDSNSDNELRHLARALCRATR